jgi:flagellin
MSFSINTNVTSLQAQNYLQKSSMFQSQTINEVTSGLRIVNSGDDAAGLAIANGFRSDEAVLNQGIQNANNGLATLQTVDGGMNNISTLLDRARTLATESASGTFSGNRDTLNQEFQSVITEVTRQATAIGMNQGGQFAQALSVFIGGGKGATSSAAASNGTINLDLSKSAVDAQSLGLQGVQAKGTAGTDIGTGSVATSVSSILANAANTASQGTAGYTAFSFSGPGFADGSKVSVSVNLGGVTDATTLASAINAAIATAGNGATQAATAFKNANITASVVTDSTGKQQLAFSSSTSAFQVQAGDTTANALLGNFSQNATNTGSNTSATADTSVAANNTLAFKFDGSSTATSVTITTGSASDSKGDIVNQLNGNSSFKLVGKASLQGNQIVIQSLNNSSTSAVQVTSSGGLTAALGLSGTATAASASTGASLNTTVQSAGALASGTVATSDSIQVQFTGAGMTSPVTLHLATTVGGTTTAASVVADLTSQVANNTALSAAGISVTSNTAGNNLVFTDSKGEKFQVGVTGDSSNTLGMGSFKADASGNFDYSTITGGTFGAPTTAASTLDISLNGGASSQLSLGVGDTTVALAAADINAQIAGATSGGLLALKNAGLQALVSSGKLELTSTSGTNFRVSGGVASGGTGDLGFGITGGAYAGTTNSAAPTVGRVDSAGAYTSSSMAFTAMASGGDSQTVSITAVDASGGSHAQAITLQNNATARTGDTIDDAIHAINTQLQQSNDSTLQSIYAVKEDNSDGTESIKFQSTTQNFKVAVSSPSDGTGITAPTGGISTATQNGSGANASIDSISGAEAAVNALANAVQNLGTAQAAVGKGENNLNYAVALAQSQSTNEAAAESQIRDANLAQEAANLTKAQILVQAGTAALAQANSAPQQLLSLLK